MPQPVGVRRFVIVSALSALAVAGLPSSSGVRAADDAYRPPQSGYDPYAPPRDGASEQDQASPDAQPPYRPGGVYREDDNYRRYEGPNTAARRPDDGAGPGPGYGEPYHPPGDYDRGPPPDDRGPPPRYDSYSQNEII